MLSSDGGLDEAVEYPEVFGEEKKFLAKRSTLCHTGIIIHYYEAKLFRKTNCLPDYQIHRCDWAKPVNYSEHL
jgi:hypothetical protein